MLRPIDRGYGPCRSAPALPTPPRRGGCPRPRLRRLPPGLPRRPPRRDRRGGRRLRGDDPARRPRLPAARRSAGGRRSGWTLLGAGVFAWGLGDTFWILAYTGAPDPPIPSPADAGYLLFYAAPTSRCCASRATAASGSRSPSTRSYPPPGSPPSRSPWSSRPSSGRSAATSSRTRRTRPIRWPTRCFSRSSSPGWPSPGGARVDMGRAGRAVSRCSPSPTPPTAPGVPAGTAIAAPERVNAWGRAVPIPGRQAPSYPVVWEPAGSPWTVGGGPRRSARFSGGGGDGGRRPRRRRDRDRG